MKIYLELDISHKTQEEEELEEFYSKFLIQIERSVVDAVEDKLNFLYGDYVEVRVVDVEVK